MIFSKNVGMNGTIPEINKNILKGNLLGKRETAQEIKFCPPRVVKINTDSLKPRFPAKPLRTIRWKLPEKESTKTAEPPAPWHQLQEASCFPSADSEVTAHGKARTIF